MADADAFATDAFLDAAFFAWIRSPSAVFRIFGQSLIPQLRELKEHPWRPILHSTQRIVRSLPRKPHTA